MKTNIMNLIKFITFICLTLFICSILTEGLIPEMTEANAKNGYTYTARGYYELEKDSIDVLFMGDSSMVYAISPMELWNDYGITSYNLSYAGIRMFGIYWNLLDALQYQNPKMVVVDSDTVFYGYKYNEGQQRNIIDVLPLTMNKVKMLGDSHFETDFFDKASYIFPILRYHDRWNDFNPTKINKKYYSTNRGVLLTGSTVPVNIKKSNYMDNYNENINFENDSQEYIKKIKKLCDEKGIKFMIIQPENNKFWGKRQNELMTNFAKENGFDFIDLNDSDDDFDWKTDSKDGTVHVNVSGTLKVTDYVGKFISSNYKLPDHRKDKKYKKWHEDYKQYVKDRDTYLARVKK